MIRIVDGADRLEAVRGLIAEYAHRLGRDLSFQHLREELDRLDEKYGPPNGQLLAAVTDGGQAIGCVAFCRHTAAHCEMKRLYVREEYRRQRVGRRLIEGILLLAQRAGYREMVLDTIRPLKSAVRLYRRFGFEEIPAYYENPMEDVIYMRLDLRGAVVPVSAPEEGEAMPPRKVLMSLKPGPFEEILAGRKRYEYRTRYPREAMDAYMYVSGSVRAVKAVVRFGAPLVGTARELVRAGAVSPEEEGDLDAYFRGGTGCAVPVDRVIPLKPVPLRELRTRFPDVSIPQSYYYLESKPRLLAFLESLERA